MSGACCCCCWLLLMLVAIAHTRTEASSSTPLPLRPEYAHPAGAEELDPYNSERSRETQQVDDEEEEGDQGEGEGGRRREEESLPQGSAGEMPMFLVEPQHAFVVRSRAARLTCRASNALTLHLECNGARVPSHSSEFVDPQSGVRIVEAECNVTRDMLDEYFGNEYTCTCHAWSSRGTVRSQHARVQLAYLKKQFPVSPMPAAVALGSSAVLQCEPPPGVPPARLTWHRQGQPLPPHQPAIKVFAGELHIAHAHLQDMANYTCVAENIAARRVSEPALLTVYVNGGWSAWSGWLPCRCEGRQRGRRRSRTCSEPHALNGGAQCAGPTEQSTPDCLPCPRAEESSGGGGGRWSSWSAWSVCGVDCRQTRTRRCLSRCTGAAEQHTSCVGDLCGGGGGGAAVGAVAAAAGAGAALLVAMAAVGAWMWRTRKRTNTRCPPEPTAEKQPLAPDLTLVRAPHSEHHYDVPQLSAAYSCPRDRRSISSCSPHRYESKACSDTDHSSTCYTSSDSTCEVMDACQVQLCALVGDTRWSRSGGAGGELRLGGGAVTLGVATTGRRVYVAVSKDDACRPRLPRGVTQLSPVVRCGPPCGPMSAAAVLKLPHCALLQHGQWDLSLYAGDNDTDDAGGVVWRRVSRVGSEGIDAPVWTHVESDAAYLLTDTLASFVLVGESCGGGGATKGCRLSVYGGGGRGGGVYDVRVYVSEDTDCAEHYCERAEERLGGTLLRRGTMTLVDDGGDVVLRCGGLGGGEHVIAFEQLWGARHNAMRYQFCLRRETCSEPIEFEVTAAQMGHASCVMRLSSSDVAPAVEERPLSAYGCVPARALRSLCAALDVPGAGGDWRALCTALGVRYSAWLASRPSPTQAALSLWLSRTNAETGPHMLANVLRDIGRPELSCLLSDSLSERSPSTCTSPTPAWL